MENADLIKISKLFTDELTLDNLPRQVTCDTINVSRGCVYWRVNIVQRNRPQLVLMCRLLNMSDWATDGILRMQLRSRLEKIKHDDVMIAKETVGALSGRRMGWSDASMSQVDALSTMELRAACNERGMPAAHLSKTDMRSRLMGDG